MTLTLYNTLTKRKEPFQPFDPANVRLYVCGPTVYDFAHIGNARPVIVFDVLFRLLRHLYGERNVTYVRNITDVDDKIMARAAEEGVAIDDLTRRTTEQFHADVAALGCLPPTVEPRATVHVPHMIAMIQTLIERGHAYEAEGHVLFAVGTMMRYGALSGRSLDEMVAGARVEIAPYKRDPMDFVLWKPSAGGEPGWDSPWGRGRPGWHIECSAMAKAHLGETFDIHGGGVDLVFPHHENEVAQSTCAHGTELMAQVWMHNGFLQVEGQKMSKSLGNFITIHDLLRDWPGEVIRLNMLKTHYRQPIDWTVKGLEESWNLIRRWRRWIETYEVTGSTVDSKFQEALLDDLNSPRALRVLSDISVAASGFFFGGGEPVPSDENTKRDAAAKLMGCLQLIGISFSQVNLKVDSGRVNELVEARSTARRARKFAEADRIREELAAMGVTLNDGPDGTTWEIIR